MKKLFDVTDESDRLHQVVFVLAAVVVPGHLVGVEVGGREFRINETRVKLRVERKVEKVEQLEVELV